MSTWRIEEFTVTEERARFEELRATVNGHRRFVPPGTYRRLIHGNITVMSDTPDELDDLREFRRRATGRVLINGLGLGCAVQMALAKLEVTHVDVVEISQEVMDLVTPRLAADPKRLAIYCDDAFTFRPGPGVRWNVIWHDIWHEISADNLQDMERLHRKYGRRCDWQGSWCKTQCQMARRRRYR